MTICSLGTEGGRIPDILVLGDRFNNAVFTYQELRRGLAKLTHTGYVVQRDQQFAAVGEAATFSSSLQGQSIRDVWAAFYRFLGVDRSAEDDPRDSDPDWNYAQLTDPLLDAAYLEWRTASDSAFSQALAYVAKKQS